MNAISTNELSTSEWRALRTNYIGGSDVAAILGESDYKTPFVVWLEKTGQIMSSVDTPVTRFGNLFESVVRTHFCEAMKVKVSEPSAMFIHPDFPMLSGNVDGIIHSATRAGKGILEIKTTTTHRVSPYDIPSSLPTEWTYQVQHYLGVTGYSYAYLQIFFRDTCEFADPILIERDEEMIQSNNHKLSNWWGKYVKAKAAPPLKDVQDLVLRYPDSCGDFREASAMIAKKYRLLQSIRERINGLNTLKSSVEFDLKEFCGESEGITIDGDPVLTWRTSNRNSMDITTFRKDHPELYKKYLKSSQTRTFKLK
ncbi:MAG: YqaJ viral recombinase family protein [Balneolaceae bacterium]|nr:YqaJ viral recombinase family protein [Balneolaceae bacterium]